MLNKAIIYYRDDIDLQNVIDFGQKEVSMIYIFFLFDLLEPSCILPEFN